MVSSSVYACHFTTVHVRANTRNNSRLMPMAKDGGDRHDAIVTMCRSWRFHRLRDRIFVEDTGLGSEGDRCGKNTRPVVKSFEPIMWVGPVFSRTEQICSNTLERQTGRHSCKQQTFSSSILIQQLLSSSDAKCSSYRVSCLRFRLEKDWKEWRFRTLVNGPRGFHVNDGS